MITLVTALFSILRTMVHLGKWTEVRVVFLERNLLTGGSQILLFNSKMETEL